MTVETTIVGIMMGVMAMEYPTARMATGMGTGAEMGMGMGMEVEVEVRGVKVEGVAKGRLESVVAMIVQGLGLDLDLSEMLQVSYGLALICGWVVF